MPIDLDTATKLSTDLTRVYKAFSSMRHHVPRFHEAIEPTAYPVLFTVAEHPMRVSEIAERIHSDVSVVSRQVTHLVDHGIFERHPDQHDRRAQVIALSDEGAHVIDAMQDARGRWFQQLLSDWEPSDAESFDRHLVQFLGTLDDHLARLRSSRSTTD